MTVGLVIFSRMDSQRLPGKALKPFGGRGRPLLGHVIDRALGARKADAVIVATSDRQTDDKIASFAQKEGAQVFRGAAQDVLNRALACAEKFGLTALGRICGDSPFLPPEIIDQMISIHKKATFEVTTNLFPRSFPAGMSFEIVSIEALRRINERTNDPYHREHVTSYIYDHSEEFLIKNYSSGLESWEGWPLTVDSLDDLAQANWLAIRLRKSRRKTTFKNVFALAVEYRQTTKKNLALQKWGGT